MNRRAKKRTGNRDKGTSNNTGNRMGNSMNMYEDNSNHTCPYTVMQTQHSNSRSKKVDSTR